MNMTVSMPDEAAELTQAFERGDLLLHYQPQVDVSQPWPVVTGYEALLRWPLPEGRFVPPDRFIRVAEDCGLIRAIDIWVIDAVCRELARMKRIDGSRCLAISANVSTQQFGDPKFAQSVSDTLIRTGLDPTSLTLEITERAVLDESETAFQNIHALHEMGVSLSLDDFGTGYSSLFQLSSLPIDEIKLDRSFISGLPLRHRDTVIAKSTIDLASALGLRVVAEGVELARQAKWLQANGCHSIQGFLFGRPSARFGR